MQFQVPPSVRVVIINWNGHKYLEKCIESISKQTYKNYEISVVDNGSSDDSIEIITKHFPEVKVINLNHNYGFATAANIGLKDSRTDYGIVMNNDAWVQENFVEVLVDVAEKDRQIASVACKVVSPTDGCIDHSYVPVFIDRRRFINKAPYLVDAPDDRQYLRQCRVLSNCACAVLYRMNALKRVGFYDENMFSNFEDHDVGYRLNLAGYISVYTPNSTVFHVGGVSEGSHASPKRVKLIVRNVLYTYAKDYENRELLSIFPQLVVALAGLSLLYWCEDGSRLMPFPWVVSYLEGVKEFLTMIPKLLRSRRAVQLTRVVSDKFIFRQASFEHFSFYRK